MQVYFTENVGRKFRDSSWCSLNKGCPLNMGSAKTGFTVKESRWQIKNLTNSDCIKNKKLIRILQTSPPIMSVPSPLLPERVVLKIHIIMSKVFFFVRQEYLL